MDRETKRRMLNEFTVTSDLNRPSGQVDATGIEREIKNILKSLSDAGVVLQQTVTDLKKGTRSTTFAYPGPSGIQAAVTANIAEVVNKNGEKNPTIKISEQRRAQYLEDQERIANARAGAAYNKEVVKSGGAVSIDKSTGVTTSLIKSREAKRLRTIVDEGEIAYTAGLAGSTISQASYATPYDKAYAGISQRENMGVAEKKAKADFIRLNPHSDLAKEEAEKKSQEAKKQSAQKAQSAKGAMLGIVSTVAAVVGTSIGILTKILGGVLETAKATTKMMLDGARFNMSSTEMNKLAGIAANMQFDLKEGSPFPAIFGGIVGKYGNVHSSGFKEAIKASAPFAREDSPIMLGLINGEYTNPQQLMDAMLAVSLNATLSGRGGVKEGMSVGAAHMVNMPNVETFIGSAQGAEMYNLMMNDMIKNKTAYKGRTFTPEEAHEYYYTMGGANAAGTADVVVPSTNARGAAENRTKDLTEVGQIWEGLKSEVFTKMLDYLGQILGVVRGMLRPLLRTLDPSAAAREDAKARAMNERLVGEHTAAINTLIPKGMKYAEAEKLSNLSIKADAGDRAADAELGKLLGGRENADTWVDKNAALIKHFQMLNYVNNNKVNNDFSYGAEEIDVAMQMENDSINRFYRRKDRLKEVDEKIDRGGTTEILITDTPFMHTPGMSNDVMGMLKLQEQAKKNTDFGVQADKLITGSRLSDLYRDKNFMSLKHITPLEELLKLEQRTKDPKLPQEDKDQAFKDLAAAHADNASAVKMIKAAGGSSLEMEDIRNGKYKDAKLNNEEMRVLLSLSEISERNKNTGRSSAPEWRTLLAKENPAVIKSLVEKLRASANNQENIQDLNDILYSKAPISAVDAQAAGTKAANAELERAQREAVKLHGSTVKQDAATKEKSQGAPVGAVDGKISFAISIPGGQTVHGVATKDGVTSTITGQSNGPSIENLVFNRSLVQQPIA